MSRMSEHALERRGSGLVMEKEPSPRKYALISVFDKTGVTDLGRVLEGLGYTIISSGGTARVLNEAGITVTPVEEVTGNPEAFDGRMKTISWQVEGGILFDRQKEAHVVEAGKLGVPQIDIVVCNLYPFAETVAKPGVTMEAVIENIDVGGPTMVRAAAKNHKSVLVVVDPEDYEKVAYALQTDKVTPELRQELAAKAFRHLAVYDGQIAHYLDPDFYQEELSLPLKERRKLRYGDNPDQVPACLYMFPWSNGESPLFNLQRLTGREPSMTNITDIDAGLRAVTIFPEAAAVVIKHNTPCGIALGDGPAEALIRALESDPESAFGGVVVLNQVMDLETARVVEQFKHAGLGQMDIIAVPQISDEALQLIQQVRSSTGVYTFGDLQGYTNSGQLIRTINGGVIIQPENNPEDSFPNWKVVTEVQPTSGQLELMRVGWKFAARIRSNTVLVIDSDLPMARGIGTGQTSRVLATKIALERAGEHAKGGILVSDSFFPKPDSVELAVQEGIAAIIQQGGSKNDQLSIDAANKAGIPMVCTGQRLFWH